MEQEEYTKEEINWSYVEFVDNQDVLDLIEKVCVCVSANSHYSVTMKAYLIKFIIWIIFFSETRRNNCSS